MASGLVDYEVACLEEEAKEAVGSVAPAHTLKPITALDIHRATWNTFTDFLKSMAQSEAIVLESC